MTTPNTQTPENLFTPPDLPADSLQSYRPSDTTNRHANSIQATQLSMTQWAVSMAGELPTTKTAKDTGCDEIGQYILRTKVGQGGFGEVWEAVQVSLNRIVAVKRVREDLLQDPDGEIDHDSDSSTMRADSFRQEALATANLDHPNIVPVHDLGLDANGMPLLAMKFVRGRPWDKVVQADFPNMPVGEFLAKHIPILIDMTQAVAFAHSKGVIHRDLKPSQVMIGEFGETMLMDWGLAVVYNRSLLVCTENVCETVFPPTPDSASSPAGTLAFMAPEQTEKTAKNIGPWTDVWLLGGTLYYLLTGRLPYQGNNPREIFLKAHLGQVLPPQKANPDRSMPEELVELIALAMQPMIQDRMQDAKVFLAHLENFQSGASRRQESTQLTEKLASELKTCERDYRTLGEAISIVARASVMWEDNPQAPELRDKVLDLYVDSALRNNDLVLARIQGEALGNEQKKNDAMRRIEAAELAAVRREHHRRIASVSALVLLFLVVIVVTVFTRRLAVQRDRAADARKDAEGILSFMLGDLLTTLEPQGQLDPVRRVGDKVVTYFENLPESEASYESGDQYLEALRVMAQTNLQLGDSEQAATFAKKYLDGARDASNKSDDPKSLENVARAYALISQIQTLQGNETESEMAFGNAIAIAAQLIDKEIRDAGKESDLPSRAEIMAMIEMQASPTDPGQNLRKLLRLLDRLTELKPDDPVMFGNNAMGYMKLSRSLRRLGEIDIALDGFTKAIAIYEQIEQNDPKNGRNIARLIEACNELGATHELNGEIPEAVSSYIQSLRHAETRVSNGNFPYGWLAQLSTSYSRIGSIAREQGNAPAAEEALNKGVALARQLAEHDPLNAQWQQDLSQHYRELATFQLEQGNALAAIQNYDSAYEISDKLLTQDPRNVLWKDSYEALGNETIRLGVMIRYRYPPEAGHAFSRAIAMSLRLLKAHPGYPSYEALRARAVEGAVLLAINEDRLPDARLLLQPTLETAFKRIDENGENAASVRTYLARLSLLNGILLFADGSRDAAIAAVQQSRDQGLTIAEARAMAKDLDEPIRQFLEATYATP